jgi:hypothetical protein
MHNNNQESLGSILWEITKVTSKCAWIGSKFIVKNTPAALGMAWQIKKEVSDSIVKAYQEGKKEYKTHLLESKIAELTKSNSNQPKKDRFFV